MTVARRILVVGGVAAGPSAASKAARTNPDVKVTLFEQSATISYGICEIPYFVAGEVRADDLVVHTPESLKKEKGVEVRTLQRVESISTAKHLITVRDISSGNVYDERFDRLIIATGARPRALNLTGEEARNVFPVRSFDGAIALHRFLDNEHPANAVIVGGGYIGIEMAEALRLRGCDVTVLEQQPEILRDLEPGARDFVMGILTAHGIKTVTRSLVVALPVDSSNRVSHVLTSDGTFPADLVIIAAGIVPATSLAAAAGIRLGRQGGILTDQRQQTSVDGIFAAGDCCEYRDIITRKWVYAPLATNANRAGWVAGQNAAGGRTTFPGVLRATALRVFEGEVVRMGLTAREARENGFQAVTGTIASHSRVSVMPRSAPLGMTLTAERDSGKILGGTLWGTEGAVLRSHALAVALHQGLTLEQFQKTDFAYSPSFSPLWDPLLVAANAVEKLRTHGTRQ
jgi:NADPH-dependent 2,4-dienoyl-CoA reductase/sulfur reductase-like enzyme